MKVAGWIVLLLLATLVATFVGAKHLGVAVPLLDEVSRQGDISLPIAFVLLLFGVVAGSMIPVARREGPWTAVGGIAGIAMAATAVITLLDQRKQEIEQQNRLAREQSRSVDLETLRLFVELEKTRPPNTRFCRCALLRLLKPGETPQFTRLLEREQVSMSEGVREMVVKCLSDVSKASAKS